MAHEFTVHLGQDSEVELRRIRHDLGGSLGRLVETDGRFRQPGHLGQGL
ncbi:hypothetical protein [Deinococcus rubellus]